ncbi:CPBP family intramembrane glutamic endopeptidase [Bacillus salacetis]|uniref:CPBP family intramembrane glutamic endopeptidase n=1 Tax=Bacillus salacetis TaxID=2315464 RepID=UPI003BA17E1E
MLNSLQAEGTKTVAEGDSRINFKVLFLYLAILAVPGYFISQLPIPYGGLKGLIWFSYFTIVTFNFRNIRALIIPMVNFNVLKKPKSYLFILLTFAIPYLLLHICIHYEVLLDRYFIFYFKNHMIEASSWGSTINAAILTPISEEILFRGILLAVLLKLVKPFWAISIISILFGLMHPSETWIFTILAGVLLTITTYKTKSLIPAMIAHSLWNLYMTQLILYF